MSQSRKNITDEDLRSDSKRTINVGVPQIKNYHAKEGSIRTENDHVQLDEMNI